jgi:two-component system chemotaxis response regulator CheB
MKPINILIAAYTSSLIRLLSEFINSAEDMKAVQAISEGRYIIDRVKKYRPDIILMEMNIPNMNGITMLKHLMLTYPSRALLIMPFNDSEKALYDQAARLGALDFLRSPLNMTKNELGEFKKDLLQKIRAANNADPLNIKFNARKETNRTNLLSKHTDGNRSFKKLIVFGSSTGGASALGDILMRLPENYPYPVIIAQHIPHNFTDSFVESLNQVSNLFVRKTVDSEPITSGAVYIAPDGYDLTLIQKGGNIYARLTPAAAGYGVISPSVDRLFSSAAKIDKMIIACLLTGIGNDGTEGIKEIYQNGGITIAQDQESSMVYSMPEHAFKSRFVKHIISPGRIADFLMAEALSVKR